VIIIDYDKINQKNQNKKTELKEKFISFRKANFPYVNYGYTTRSNILRESAAVNASLIASPNCMGLGNKQVYLTLFN